MKLPDHFILHIMAIVLIMASGWWAYYGFVQSSHNNNTTEIPHAMSIKQNQNHSSKFKVQNKDEAVRAYLKLAQLQAEIYFFTNNNSYSGMCEHSKTLYSLEDGVLMYIKAVGATKVFCSNSSTVYMIESKLPMNGMFYCIDSTGEGVEQKETREGSPSCK